MEGKSLKNIYYNLSVIHSLNFIFVNCPQIYILNLFYSSFRSNKYLQFDRPILQVQLSKQQSQYKYLDPGQNMEKFMQRISKNNTTTIQKSLNQPILLSQDKKYRFQSRDAQLLKSYLAYALDQGNKPRKDIKIWQQLDKNDFRRQILFTLQKLNKRIRQLENQQHERKTNQKKYKYQFEYQLTKYLQQKNNIQIQRLQKQFKQKLTLKQLRITQVQTLNGQLQKEMNLINDKLNQSNNKLGRNIGFKRMPQTINKIDRYRLRMTSSMIFENNSGEKSNIDRKSSIRPFFVTNNKMMKKQNKVSQVQDLSSNSAQSKIIQKISLQITDKPQQEQGCELSYPKSKRSISMANLFK